MSITFKKMKETDIPVLIPIMKRAFDYDTQIHLGREIGGPPGYDDGSFLRKWGLNPAASPFCIYKGDELIGGTILWINQDHKNFLGTLFIDTKHQEKGIGTMVWQLIETMYPQTKIWSTETPIFSRRNHAFYVNKCGFHVIRIQEPKNLEEGSYHLQKVM